jgi:hypothetical protein
MRTRGRRGEVYELRVELEKWFLGSSGEIYVMYVI